MNPSRGQPGMSPQSRQRKQSCSTLLALFAPVQKQEQTETTERGLPLRSLCCLLFYQSVFGCGRRLRRLTRSRKA